jgi:hypothetical protein
MCQGKSLYFTISLSAKTAAWKIEDVGHNITPPLHEKAPKFEYFSLPTESRDMVTTYNSCLFMQKE